MKMQLIQPFISAADAVLAEALGAPAAVGDLSMEEESYRKKGIAAIINIRGEIEGRVILDMEPQTAVRVASHLAGGQVEESEEIVRETVSELASMVIGNAITLLNDHGFRFKVFPPEVHSEAETAAGNADTEAMVMCFDTPSGRVYLNIAMRYNRRRARERAVVVE